MQEVPLPTNEIQRLAALHSLQLLDTIPEERFERITRVVQRLFEVPIASITLIDANRQWFKSCLGLSISETSRDIAFCAYAILNDDAFIIPDAQLDPRFADNPLVTGDPYIRFYAGQPLKGPNGHNIGTLCIIDRQPRQMSSGDVQTLKDIAHWAENEINAISLQQALTAQRQTEEALQKSEARFRAIFDATSEAIVLVSPDRRFLSVNHQFTEIFGLKPDVVLGRRFQDFQKDVEQIFADPVQFQAKVVDTASDAERQFTEIVAQILPKPRELELYSSPVRGLDNTYLGRLYVFRDVTREREVDRMKSEFVSLVSHELRTPLTSIKGYVDLLMDGDAGELDEEQQEYLSIVKNNADRLVALINDLLDVSRIEAGKIELHREVLSLTPLIQEVAQSLRPQIEQKEQQLTLELSETLPTVLGDANRITQILTNLLSNAYKYTFRGGIITITTKPTENGYARVEVRDNGIGLSADEQDKLFTKFYRAKNPTTQQVGGTGLGLTITRSLVEMQGGKMEVTSTPGHGSTFSFTLPVAQRITQLLPPLVTPPSGGRILVVDDEPDIAHLIRRYLEHAHYEVLLAHNATQALHLARTEYPDLITLDILLPDADGFTVLEWLKSDSTTAHIPVIMLSMMDDSSQGKLLGAVDYLTKPIQERVLLERVGMILSDSTHMILVADDEVDLRHLIAGNLRRAGYEVIEAANGDEAVTLALQYHPGLALLDIKMPGIDGITALRTLRTESSTRNMPVIMMTASPGVLEESKSVVEALGGTTLLSKPCTIEELAMAIAQSITTRR